MMHDQVDSFIKSLISITQEGGLNWLPFSMLTSKETLFEEISSTRNNNREIYIDSIDVDRSYYLKRGQGVTLLLTKRSDVNVFDNSVTLFIKINPIIPVIDLSGYDTKEDEDKKLKKLRIVVEQYLEQKYSMPDALYKYMEEVLDIQSDCNNDNDFDIFVYSSYNYDQNMWTKENEDNVTFSFENNNRLSKNEILALINTIKGTEFVYDARLVQYTEKDVIIYIKYHRSLTQLDVVVKSIMSILGASDFKNVEL